MGFLFQNFLQKSPAIRFTGYFLSMDYPAIGTS